MTPKPETTTDQITVWWYPNHVMKTQYGAITFREWLAHEARRIAAMGRKCVIVDEVDYCCLRLDRGV